MAINDLLGSVKRKVGVGVLGLGLVLSYGGMGCGGETSNCYNASSIREAALLYEKYCCALYPLDDCGTTDPATKWTTECRKIKNSDCTLEEMQCRCNACEQASNIDEAGTRIKSCR